MRGKLKNVEFFIGEGVPFSPPKGDIVTIIDKENHHIFGNRYKIKGYDEWFEENCFEYIAET